MRPSILVLCSAWRFALSCSLLFQVQREQALYHEWKFQEARKKAEESGAKPDHGHH